ncbi:MAG: potassium channel family protein [Pelosinus sp.]|nr:potassium channel family protein [Pelosinus sp.]
MPLQSIKKWISFIKSKYIIKPLMIALLSIIAAYYLPDVIAHIFVSDLPDLPDKQLGQRHSFFEIVHCLSVMGIFIASCCISFYGIYGLTRYTLFERHPGGKRLRLVLVSYLVIIVGFANTFFLLSFLGDSYDAVHKFAGYYKIAQDAAQKELMLKNQYHLPNYNSLSGIKTKFWSGVDTKEQSGELDEEDVSDIAEELPVAYIFNRITYPQPKVIKYLPENKQSIYGDCLYFSTITIASVGYGDIAPQTRLVKFLVCLETLMGQLLLALGVSSAYSGISHLSKNVHPSKERATTIQNSDTTRKING